MLVEIDIAGSLSFEGTSLVDSGSSEVPEPKTILLLLVGTLMLVSRKTLQTH